MVPILESVTPAAYHASTTCVRPLQEVQHLLLKTMGVADELVFTHYVLAPLHLCRDVAMLGVLHKCAHRRVRGSAHALCCAGVRSINATPPGAAMRGRCGFHTMVAHMIGHHGQA